VLAHGFFEQRIQFGASRIDGPMRIGADRQLPITLRPHHAVAPFQPIAGTQFLDAIHQRERGWNVVQRQVTVQTGQADAPVDLAMFENRLQFGAEVQIAVADGVVQRLNSHAIARQHQAPRRFRPDGHPEHTAQVREAVSVPLQKRRQHHLGVGFGLKFVTAALQFEPQFGMVVNFAVENDDTVAAGVVNRLVAGLQVDDFQTGGAERDRGRFVHTLLVRSAMQQRLGDTLYASRIRTGSVMRKTSNSTHGSMSPECALRYARRVTARPFRKCKSPRERGSSGRETPL